MPYRHNNYSFTIDSSFNPFSMQEMLTPFLMYKNEFDKQEAVYDELNRKAGDFQYLAETLPEGSKAKAIYEGYANDLATQAKDFSSNGLSMNNRRALTDLKRRYAGEIGRLEKASTAMEEERKLRRQMNAKDSSLLYATDNLNIDEFLDGRNPNLYSVSGEDLRKEAAQYAQAASSRIYGDTRIQNINKYFQDIIQKQGYSPEALAAWRQNLESIPEFNQAVEDIMSARGVTGNLTGANLERARQNIINGIMEGSAYQEKRQAHQNPGVLTAAQAASNALGWANHNLHAAASGMVKDPASPTGYKYDINYDPKHANDLWMYKVEDGQIKGYSDEYLNAVKEGTLGVNGKPKTSKEEKVEDFKPAPDPKVSYDATGGMKEAKGTANNPLDYGTPLTDAEAMEKYPDAVARHGTDKYKYYEKGGRVYPVPYTSEELKSKSKKGSSLETSTGNGSNHNAV